MVIDADGVHREQCRCVHGFEFRLRTFWFVVRLHNSQQPNNQQMQRRKKEEEATNNLIEERKRE
jgi:hypothetical protein